MDFEKYRYIALKDGYFDPEFYIRQILARGISLPPSGWSLFEHFVNDGFRNQLEPSRKFSSVKYLLRYSDIRNSGIDPLYHFLTTGRNEGRIVEASVDNEGPIQTIAFYLPQYHPIPENDSAWGPGFTEWTNVTRAKPSFPGHNHPYLPSELGFYDLRLAETMRRQAQIAGEYGIGAFCFYHYWFSGRELLKKPIDNFLADATIDFPFCICWANENWSRRWDGMDNDIIVSQVHSPESDYSYIYGILDIIADTRYVRVEGKPLLIIYRPDLLASPKETIALWRQVAELEGLEGLYVCGVRFHTSTHAEYGLDALVEFPPHHFPAEDYTQLRLDRLGVGEQFEGTVRDMESGVDRRVGSTNWSLPSRMFPGVMPSWDNTARRGHKASIYHGGTPELFTYWLAAACEEAVRNAPELAPLVFINAWNEWAEGAVLEPSQAWQRSWLNAVRAAISTASKPLGPLSRMRDLVRSIHATEKQPILVFSHDAHIGGSQLLLLRLIDSLNADGEQSCCVVLMNDGPLRQNFEAVAPTLCLSDLTRFGWTQETSLRFLARRLREARRLVVLSNTVATSEAAIIFSEEGHNVVGYIHELPTSIDMYGFKARVPHMIHACRRTLTVSSFVRDALAREFSVPLADMEVLHTGLRDSSPEEGTVTRKEIFERFGLPEAKHLIVGCGLVHMRKGPDLFVKVAAETCRLLGHHDCVFVWLGGDQSSDEVRRWAMHDAAALGVADRVFFVGHDSNPKDTLRNASALVLSSREDPFPLVVLEAIEVGIPVVCFQQGGGAPEIVSRGVGAVAPGLDTIVMAEQLVRILQSDELQSIIRSQAAGLRSQFSWNGYVGKVSDRLASLNRVGHLRSSKGDHAHKIAEDLCVVVPSYNHRDYIVEALDSIFSQSLRPIEIRIIDDGSTDGSDMLLKQIANGRSDIHLKVRENHGAHATINEAIGSTECEYVAILNSDDRYHPLRFEQMLHQLRDNRYDILFSRARIIQGDGRYAGANAWYETALEGIDRNNIEWQGFLTHNALLTTTNIVARKAAIKDIGGFRPFRYCHDLDFILRALLLGVRVGFEEATLCDYRLHEKNTIRESDSRVAEEEAFVIADILHQYRPYQSIEEVKRICSLIREKNLCSLVHAFLEGLSNENFQFQYETAYTKAWFINCIVRAAENKSSPDVTCESLINFMRSQLKVRH